MRTNLNKFLWLYQRIYWHVGITIGELRKPLPPTEFWTILTLLTVKGFGWTWGMALLVYVVIMVVFLIAGKILVWSGVVAYNSGLSNQQSPQLMETLARLKRIEKKLGIEDDML